MKHFRKVRRTTAAVALAGLAMAGVIGFVYNFQPDPGYTGGLAPTYQTDPDYIVGRAPGTVMFAYGTPGPEFGGGVTPADAPLTGF